MTSGSCLKRGKNDKGLESTEKVVVAVKASKEISKTALVWALTHVVQPGDCITLLVVTPSQGSGIISSLFGFFVLFLDSKKFDLFWSKDIHFTSRQSFGLLVDFGCRPQLTHFWEA